MNKEEINVDVMTSEELEEFEYLIQNFSKSKLAYKVMSLQQENKQLKEQYAFLNEKYELLYNLKKQKVEENVYAKKIEVKSKETLLQETINKAIEYINNFYPSLKIDNCNELLEILKDNDAIEK